MGFHSLCPCLPLYLVIVCIEVNALWELHALILVDSPELAVVRRLALTLAFDSWEVVPEGDGTDQRNWYVMYESGILCAHESGIIS